MSKWLLAIAILGLGGILAATDVEARRLGGGRNGVMNKGAHLARLLLLDVFQWIEVFDFTSESDRKLGGVKFLNVIGATASIHQRSPRFFNRIANGSYQAEARDNNTTCQL